MSPKALLAPFQLRSCRLLSSPNALPGVCSDTKYLLLLSQASFPSPPPHAGELSFLRGLFGGLIWKWDLGLAVPGQARGPWMVSSRRGLRNPSPISNYANEKEGPPSIALLSDFGRAFSDMFLTQQLCKEGWPLTSLPGWQPCEGMGTCCGLI